MRTQEPWSPAFSFLNHYASSALKPVTGLRTSKPHSPPWFRYTFTTVYFQVRVPTTGLTAEQSFPGCSVVHFCPDWWILREDPVVWTTVHGCGLIRRSLLCSSLELHLPVISQVPDLSLTLHPSAAPGRSAGHNTPFLAYVCQIILHSARYRDLLKYS